MLNTWMAINSGLLIICLNIALAIPIAVTGLEKDGIIRGAADNIVVNTLQGLIFYRAEHYLTALAIYFSASGALMFLIF